ncbi:MAG: ABC transporter permease [Chryseolinea sp.]
MIRYYIKVAFRYLTRNKQYTFLNIFGLSVGLTCFVVISAWVRSELSFDTFHKDADRIYRVISSQAAEPGSAEQAVTGPPLGSAIIDEFPEVAQVVRIDPVDATLRVGAEMFFEDNILVTEPSFLDVFNFPLLRGDARTALQEPYSIVMSEQMARRYFGDADPIGQDIHVFLYDPDGNGMDFKVTGVIQDCPKETHFRYQALISFSTMVTARPTVLERGGWFNPIVYTYVKLQADASEESVNARFPKMAKDHYDLPTGSGQTPFKLQRLKTIHLQSNLMYEMKPNGSMLYVIVFSTTAIIVLLLACMNYINLATAYAVERFREVGIQKVMGGTQMQLLAQHLAESWMLSLGSLILSICWIELSRPLFASLTGDDLSQQYSIDILATLFTASSVTGIVSGFYPAFIMSGWKPVNALMKRGLVNSPRRLRKTILVVQYTLSTILVVGILVVHYQMKYINNKDLGFDKAGLVVFGVHGSREVMAGYPGFADELLKNPHVKGVARSNTTIGGGLGNHKGIIEQSSGMQLSVDVFMLRVDHRYLNTYGVELTAGRNFIEGNAFDSTSGFIVNEAAINAAGYLHPVDAIGRSFEVDGVKGSIVGVVKDFHFDGLRHTVEPQFIRLLKGGFSRISIRLDTDTNDNLARVVGMWKKHFPNSAIQYSFYEDTLAKQYQGDTRFYKLFLLFSGISLVIACMGLYSMVSYNVHRRTKEISIRKILGASLLNIATTITGEFAILIAISLTLALPAAYWLMQTWLSEFAYHIELNALTFVTAGGLVIMIAAATISLRVVKASLQSPSRELRSE